MYGAPPAMEITALNVRAECNVTLALFDPWLNYKDPLACS